MADVTLPLPHRALRRPLTGRADTVQANQMDGTRGWRHRVCEGAVAAKAHNIAGYAAPPPPPLQASPQSVPPVFLWENQEGIPRLNADVAEGVVVDLLSSPPAGLAQTPLWFLLGCYGRASHELRTTVSYIRDKEKVRIAGLGGARNPLRVSITHGPRPAPPQADKVYDALKQLQKIIVNYACLLLTAPEVFPQPPGDVQRGPLLLLVRSAREALGFPHCASRPYASAPRGSGTAPVFGAI